jgi:hypothetical protein
MKKYIPYNEIDLSDLSKDELLDLKKEYELKFHKSLDPEDKSKLEDIINAIRGFKVDNIKSSKFKKSKRVNPFNKGRI